MNKNALVAFFGKILMGLAIFYGGYSLFSDLSKELWWWVLILVVFVMGFFLRVKFRSP